MLKIVQYAFQVNQTRQSVDKVRKSFISDQSYRCLKGHIMKDQIVFDLLK